MLDGIIVEVRDRNLVRQGAVAAVDVLELTTTPIVNAVGGWSLKMRADHPLAAVLREPGSGIVVTTPYDVFSGPTIAPESSRGLDDRAGTITFTGVDDNQVLWDRLAYPQPSNANTETQNVDHDIRTGVAETVMHGYVNANIGPSGPAARQVASLSMGTDGGRGATITKEARFDVLGDLLSGIAAADNLRFRVVQRGGGLVFETDQVRDLSKQVRLDVDNNTLIGHKVAVQAPTATHAIVGAADVTLDRIFATVTTPESLAASEVWGRRIERFVDQAYVLDEDAFTQTAREMLATEGITTVVAQGIPPADSNVVFGRDWSLGDKVSIVVEGQELASVVTGSITKIDSSGVVVGAVLGDATGFNVAAKATRAVERVAARVSHLERNPTPIPTAPSSQFTRQAASATVTVATTTTVVPGTSVTVQSDGPSDEFEVTGIFDVRVATGSASYFVGSCEVNGVAQDGQAIYRSPVDNSGGMNSQHWRVTGIPAGSAVIRLTVSKTTSGGVMSAQSTHTTISVRRVT